MAAQAKVIRDEIDILYGASNKLTQVETPAEWLEAVSEYARDIGATSGILLWTDLEAGSAPNVWLEVVAEWVRGSGRSMGIGTRFWVPSRLPIVVQQPVHDRPLLIPDVPICDALPQQIRDYYAPYHVRGAAILPLYVKDRWHGLLVFGWNTPYLFDDRDQRIFIALLRQAAPVIDSMRLFDQMQKRATDLEMVKSEIELLYKASAAINAASSFGGIVEAISHLNLSDLMVMLGVWENYDFERASYIEVTVTDQATNWSAARHVLLDDVPLVSIISWSQQLAVEDVNDRSQVDEATAAILEQQGTRAFISTPLLRNERWIGQLAFVSPTPRQFSARDRRVIAGVADLVAAAFERMRLQTETEAARRRAEILVQVNAALSQAQNEWDVLAAIALYANPLEPDNMSLNFVEEDARGNPSEMTVVAVWEHGKAVPDSPIIGRPYGLAAFPATSLWANSPDAPLMIADVTTDQRLDDHTRRFLIGQNHTALVIIPFHSGRRWQGSLGISWGKPREFGENDKAICTALIQTAGAVVTSRRAFLAAEEARQESQFLYRASEAINAAKTFADITLAVSRLYLTDLNIVLGVWENFDFDSATYIEITAKTRSDHFPISMRIPADRVPIAQAISQRDLLLVIEDTADREQVDEVTASKLEQQETRALLNVTLWLNNRWLGSLNFHSAVPRKFSAREKRLVTGIGDLVVAALERMRLQQATEKARQRAELLAQVNANLSQATDEQGILAAVAALVERYGVDLSHLAYVLETDDAMPTTVEVVAIRTGDGTPQPLSVFPTTIYPSDRYPFLQLAFRNPDKVTYVENLLADERPEAIEQLRYHPQRVVNWQATISLPLIKGDMWQGVLTFLWFKPQIFTEEILALFAEIRPTATSVVATRRAYLAEGRARQETEQRVRELETVAEVSAAATRLLDINALLNTVSNLTKTSFNLYHAHIYLVDEAGENLVLAASPDEPGRAMMAEGRKLPLDSPSVVGRAARMRDGVIVNDVEVAEDYLNNPLLPETRSEMAVPMIVGDRLIGVLDVQSRHVNRFTESDMRVLTTLADQVAIAVQNARLYMRAQELAIVEERNRIARELHDSVSQALYGIALGTRTARAQLARDPAKVADPLDYVLSLAEAGLTEMRALIFELRPESLQNEGLVVALTKQAASLQARHRINVLTNLCEEPPVPMDVKEALYHIARESLHNIIKHARATEVQVCMESEDSTLLLEVCDNGVGFDVTGSFPGHLGLQSMRERALRVKGTFHMESAPGEGTRMRVTVPV